jgi:hypothetical protein
MLRHKLQFLTIALLVFLLVAPTYIAFVSSSTGYIRVNSISPSAPGQQVQAGENVNLYFGEVMWEGSQFYLLLSHDTSSQLSAGDSIYTPRFSVYDVTNTSASTTYTSADGQWKVGYDWINGTIPVNIPIGNYSIKAADQVTANVAVTDTFITVYSVVYSSTLEISPSSGPGGVPIQFTGSGYPINSSVTISYYDPTYGSWNAWATTTADSTGHILVDSIVPDLRKSVGIGDYPETYATVSYRAEIGNFVYSYADYNQYSRGLKRVGNVTASGLFGNGTSLVSTVKVEVGDSIAVSGKWFHPGDVIYVKWDGTAVVGTVTSDQWSNIDYLNSTIANPDGFFELDVTIPNSEAGEHYLAVEDLQTRVIVKILVSQGSFQISPSSGPGGVNAQFIGSGFPNSTDVTIAYLDSIFGWNTWATTTTDAAGNFVFSSEIPDLRRSLSAGDSYSESYNIISFRAEVGGFVYCYVDYNQYARGLKRVGNQVANGLFGNGTNLATPNASISVTVKSGDTITVSGKWFHPGDPVYIRWDGKAVVGTVTSNEWLSATILGSSIASASTGSFEKSVTIPAADVGEHYLAVEDSQARVIVQVYVDSAPAPSPSPEPTPEPTPSPSKASPVIDVSCRSTTTSTALKVEINGQLSFNGASMAGEKVLISYSPDGGKSWESLTSVDTLLDGRFTALWTPSFTGNILVKARWEGNETFNEAANIVNVAIMPYTEQSVFMMSSNSTISQFAFNSTSQEITFTASGPEHTTGYVNLYIPKTLISDINDLKVYIDGNQVTYTSESQTDSWGVSFTYSHSEHRVVLKLSGESSSNGTPTGYSTLIIIAIGVVAAIVIPAIVFKVIRGSKKDET